MPTSLIAPLAVAGGSALFNSAFGDHNSPTAPLTSFQPAGINAGGLSATFGGQNFNVTADATRQGLVGNIANTFGMNADEIAKLRARVAPGVSDLRAARMAEIENARSSAVGNLRDNMARRRVLGSSFAQDAISRAEAEFSQQKQQAAAESFMQELELTNNLLQQEFTARRGQFQTGLDELNLEANLATNLAGKATDILGKNAQMEAQLMALEQQNMGKFFGQFIAPGIQSGTKSLFGGIQPTFGSSTGGFGSGTFNASGAI